MHSRRVLRQTCRSFRPKHQIKRSISKPRSMGSPQPMLRFQWPKTDPPLNGTEKTPQPNGTAAFSIMKACLGSTMASQCQDCIQTSKSKGIRESNLDVCLARLVRHHVQGAFRIWFIVVDSWRNHPVTQGHDARQ